MVEYNPEPDDIELLRRAGDGDGAAFHELVDRHAQRLFRLAVTLVGNSTDAEDVLQEAFVGAFKGIGAFEGRASVKTWLTRILVMQAAQWRRKKKGRGTESMSDSVPAAGKSAEAGMDVQWAIGQLSPQHREVMVLREFEQMSYEEIAGVLGIPRGTVESRLHRARSEMRETLKDYLP